MFINKSCWSSRVELAEAALVWEPVELGSNPVFLPLLAATVCKYFSFQSIIWWVRWRIPRYSPLTIHTYLHSVLRPLILKKKKRKVKLFNHENPCGHRTSTNFQEMENTGWGVRGSGWWVRAGQAIGHIVTKEEKQPSAYQSWERQDSRTPVVINDWRKPQMVFNRGWGRFCPTPRGYWSMSKDIFDCHEGLLVGRSQGCCWTFFQGQGQAL